MAEQSIASVSPASAEHATSPLSAMLLALVTPVLVVLIAAALVVAMTSD